MGNKFTPEGIAKLFKRLGGSRGGSASMASIMLTEAQGKVMLTEDSHTDDMKRLSISTSAVVIAFVELCTLMNQDIEGLTEHVASLTARVAKLEGAE